MLICDISITHKYGKLALDALLSPLHLCWQEMVVLLVLHESPEAPQSLLNQLLQTDKGNVTKLLKRMEENNLVKRDVNKQDNRRKDNALTEKGARLIPALNKALADWESLCFEGLTPEEISVFNKASCTIMNNTMHHMKQTAKEETI
ncbi:MAG: MarR family transcriptional regulator [Clostridiales bacterium]|nr:MarR family transcriptional regulator [Clostridiales bacterium]